MKLIKDVNKLPYKHKYKISKFYHLEESYSIYEDETYYKLVYHSKNSYYYVIFTSSLKRRNKLVKMVRGIIYKARMTDLQKEKK